MQLKGLPWGKPQATTFWLSFKALVGTAATPIGLRKNKSKAKVIQGRLPLQVVARLSGAKTSSNPGPRERRPRILEMS